MDVDRLRARRRPSGFKDIRFGLIGLGHHGMRYVRHLSGDVSGARLVAVCRRDRHQGEALAAGLGVRYYDDYRALLDDSDVDAALIVSPTGCHLEMAVAAAEHGKPILLEKPIAATLAEADEILAAVRARNVPLMVAQTLRYEPLAEEFRKALPGVGSVRALNLQHRSRDIRVADDTGGGTADYRGVVLDTGVHYFDLVLWLFPGRVDAVRCEIRRHERVRTEDAFVAVLSGPDLLSVIDICRATPARHETWVAAGETGVLVADRFQNTLSLVSPEGPRTLPAPEPAPTLPRVIGAFVRSLTTGAPVEVPGEPARAAVAVAEACFKSAEEGRAVHLNEV